MWIGPDGYDWAAYARGRLRLFDAADAAEADAAAAGEKVQCVRGPYLNSSIKVAPADRKPYIDPPAGWDERIERLLGPTFAAFADVRWYVAMPVVGTRQVFVPGARLEGLPE